MSRWEEEFENNPIHASLNGLREFLDAENENTDSDIALEKRRFEKVLDLIDRALEGVDRELAPITLLNQLNGHLRQPQVWNNLQAFSSNPEVGYLQGANNHINTQLQTIYQIAAFSKPPKAAHLVKPIEKAYDDFCKKIDLESNTFEKLTKELKAQLDETSSNHKTLIAEMAALKNDYEGRVNAWATEFSESQNQNSTKFNDSEIARREQFSEWMVEFTNSSNGKLEIAFENFQAKIDDYQNTAAEKHKSILDIHGLVASDGVAGGYKQTADNEGIAANKWRWATIAALVAAAGWLALKLKYLFTSQTSGNLNWEEILTSVSLTAIILAIAAYTSKQSTVHRNAEKRLRWFALEVKAIDPFLESLGEVERNKLKGEICRRIFGQTETDEKSEKPDADLNMVKAITDLVKNLKP